jgi:hypothetical protein
MSIKDSRWQKGDLVGNIAIRIPINDGQLIPLSNAVRMVIRKLGVCVIPDVPDAGVLHVDVFGRLEIHVRISQD